MEFSPSPSDVYDFSPSHDEFYRFTELSPSRDEVYRFSPSSDEFYQVYTPYLN